MELQRKTNIAIHILSIWKEAYQACIYILLYIVLVVCAEKAASWSSSSIPPDHIPRYSAQEFHVLHLACSVWLPVYCSTGVVAGQHRPAGPVYNSPTGVLSQQNDQLQESYSWLSLVTCYMQTWREHVTAGTLAWNSWSSVTLALQPGTHCHMTVYQCQVGQPPLSTAHHHHRPTAVHGVQITASHHSQSQPARARWQPTSETRGVSATMLSLVGYQRRHWLLVKTLHNNYWDRLHHSLVGICSSYDVYLDRFCWTNILSSISRI